MKKNNRDITLLNVINESSAPRLKTRSRHGTESPAILPRAHAACSLTSSLSEVNNLTKISTAPALITTLVCSEVPDAIFVSAHAASNCKGYK